MRGLGLSVDIVRLTAGSNLLVAAVNKDMRRTHGKLHTHISQFDYIPDDRSLIDTKIDSKEMEYHSKIGTFIANNLFKEVEHYNYVFIRYHSKQY